MIGRFVSPHRLTLYVVAIALPLLLVGSHVAAAGREPTAIAVAAPASATLGEQVTSRRAVGHVQRTGRRRDGAVRRAHKLPQWRWGHGVATAMTNKEGVASAQFEARITGSLEVRPSTPATTPTQLPSRPRR